MKKIPLLLLFAVASLALHAQDFTENFEHGGSLPEGWTTYSSGTTYKWSVAKYSTFGKYYTGFNGGDTYAMKSTTGKITSSRPAPNSWLISPAVTVPENGVLNFMMVTDGSFNKLETTPEEARTHFSVLVSETTADTTAFTHEVVAVSPYGVGVWQNYSVDLSQWAGKTIYIAFHDYGNTTGKAYTSNSVYLDNVSVDTRRGSDVSVTEIVSPLSGDNPDQAVAVKVRNNGFDTDGVKVSYILDGGTEVSETLQDVLARGEEVTHTFVNSLTLSQGKPHDIKVWATATADLNHDNDSLSTAVSIDRHLSFPYVMTPATAANDWESSFAYEKQGSVYGWSYVDDSTKDIHAWSYITPSAGTSELVSGWIPFPKGKVGFRVNYKSLSSGQLTVTLLDKDANIVATSTLPFTSADNSNEIIALLNVGEEKECRAVLTVNDGYSTQLLVNGVSFYAPEPVDVRAIAITSPQLSAYADGGNLIVEAEFANYGSETVSGHEAKLEVDGQELESATLPDIASGATVNFSFDSRLQLADGTHTLAVIAGNDSVKKSLVIYQPQAYPYQETFEDTVSWKWWNSVNKDADPVYWTVMGVVKGNINYAKNGTHAAYVSSAANIVHDDWLISPAINITKTGRQRLSFFYVTTYKAASAGDVTTLDVYVDQKNNPDTLSEKTPVTTVTLTDDNLNVYRQGFVTIDVATPGLYYIAFHNTGRGHDIVLDDVRLDNGTDLAVVSASHTATNGFHLSGDSITVNLQNRGATDIHTITLRTLNNDSVVASAVIDTLLHPGEEATLSFDGGYSLSRPGIYNIGVEAVADNDQEAFNNKWQFAPVECFADATLPYEEDLDSLRNQEQWTLTGKWKTGSYTSSNSAYNGTGAISHHGKPKTGEDWAYSGCISIPAGVYDLSFFYRTFLNGTNVDRYGQNFAVYLGTACNPDSMTIPVYESDESVVAPEKRYRKVISTVEIPDDGEYYIGVKCTSTTALGVLYMDAFAINETVVNGTQTDNYLADFGARGDEWYHYDPSTQFQQWKPSASDPQLLEVRQSVQKDLMPTELPGLLASLPFEFEEGDRVSLELGYSIAIDHPECFADSTKAGIGMAVWASTVNLPDSFNIPLLRDGDLTGDAVTAHATYTIPNDGIYYFGILPYGAEHTTSGEAIITYTLRSFSFNRVSTGVREVGVADGLCRVYRLDGVLVGTYGNEAEVLKRLAPGTYIIKKGMKVRKALVMH